MPAARRPASPTAAELGRCTARAANRPRAGGRLVGQARSSRRGCCCCSGLGTTIVGRNLQGHYYPTVFGRFDEPVHDSRGPGVAIATTAFTHGNDGVIGGAMLADEFVMTPVILFKQALPPGVRRWGLEAKDYMRREFSPHHQDHRAGARNPLARPRASSLADVTDRLGLRVRKALRDDASRDRAHRGLYRRARRGVAPRIGGDRDLGPALTPQAVGRAASGRHLPDGPRSRRVGRPTRTGGSGGTTTCLSPTAAFIRPTGRSTRC